MAWVCGAGGGLVAAWTPLLPPRATPATPEPRPAGGVPASAGAIHPACKADADHRRLPRKEDHRMAMLAGHVGSRSDAAEVDTFSRTSPLHHHVAASPVRVDAAQLDTGVGGQPDRGTSARTDLGVAQAQRAALNT
jgi:hypothetical protein